MLREGCVANATHRPFYPQERDPVPILQEAGWAPGPVWTAAENLAPTGIQSMETVQPVASRYTDRAAPVQNLSKKQRPLTENEVSTFICLHRPTSWYW